MRVGAHAQVQERRKPPIPSQLFASAIVVSLIAAGVLYGVGRINPSVIPVASGLLKFGAPAAALLWLTSESINIERNS